MTKKSHGSEGDDWGWRWQEIHQHQALLLQQREKEEKDALLLQQREKEEKDALLLQQREKEEKEDVLFQPGGETTTANTNECCVCLEKTKNTVLVPCHNMCLCESCAEDLMKNTNASCPLCHAKVHKTIKIFL